MDDLRHAKNDLEAIFDASQQAVFLMDTDGMVVDANAETARRLNLRVEEIVGKSVFDFLPADVASRRKQYAEEAIRTRQPVRFEDPAADRIISQAAVSGVRPAGQRHPAGRVRGGRDGATAFRAGAAGKRGELPQNRRDRQRGHLVHGRRLPDDLRQPAHGRHAGLCTGGNDRPAGGRVHVCGGRGGPLGQNGNSCKGRGRRLRAALPPQGRPGALDHRVRNRAERRRGKFCRVVCDVHRHHRAQAGGAIAARVGGPLPHRGRQHL